jgi:hypothetical protein
MFLLSLVNIDSHVRELDTFEAAIAEARRIGFDSIIQNSEGGNVIVASYSALYGLNVKDFACRKCGEANDTEFSICSACVVNPCETCGREIELPENFVGFIPLVCASCYDADPRNLPPTHHVSVDDVAVVRSCDDRREYLRALALHAAAWITPRLDSGLDALLVIEAVDNDVDALLVGEFLNHATIGSTLIFPAGRDPRYLHVRCEQCRRKWQVIDFRSSLHALTCKV